MYYILNLIYATFSLRSGFNLARRRFGETSSCLIRWRGKSPLAGSTLVDAPLPIMLYYIINCLNKILI